MRTTQIQDPFLHNQPKMTFAEDLAKPLHTAKPPRWNDIPAGEKEVDFSTVNLQLDFQGEFLETAFRDGSVKITGTDIDKLIPPMSRFGGGNRAEKKQGVIAKYIGFFEKYFGIG